MIDKLVVMTQIVLRTALSTSNYKAAKNSPVEIGPKRISQYSKNAEILVALAPELFSNDVLVVDNTVESPCQMTEVFESSLPNTVRYIATGTNSFGRFNKGAGDSETYRHLIRNRFVTRSFLHLELRLRPIAKDFINDFLVNPRSTARMNLDSTIQSGCIGYSYEDATRFFWRNAKPLLMTLGKVSIENLLSEYWGKYDLSIWQGAAQFLRHDPRGRDEEY
jgi:hypothetical protein